jgi:ABC-type multidrug transport system permease subunit
MFKRRSQGPAFERSPFERLSDWSSRNLLTLASALAAAAIFIVIVNFTVNYLLNFLMSGEGQAEQKFYDDHWAAITVKIVGALAILFGLIKSRAK